MAPAFTGGVRAHAQLSETLSSALARVVARPPVVVAHAYKKIQDGRFTDKANLKFALEAIPDLIEEVSCCARQVTRDALTFAHLQPTDPPIDHHVLVFGSSPRASGYGSKQSHGLFV